MKERLVKLDEFDPKSQKYYDYTTIKRGIGFYYLYSPSTYEEDSFTDYASGRSINLNIRDLKNLYKTNPKAYVHFLVSDSYSTAWVMVKNIRLIVT